MNKSPVQLSWVLSAGLLTAIFLFGVRWGTNILLKGPVYDEQYITVPIDNLIKYGWSVSTAINFEETKGPAMIWPYAILGNFFGGTLNDLRLVSVWSSIFASSFLAWLALLRFVPPKLIIWVTIGWLLLPYNLIFSEIVMGEVSYLLLSLIAVSAFVFGVGRSASQSNWIAPALYCIALALALHSRIHVVAVAGAVCLTAFGIQGKSSWPWWLATIVAGLLRIPLWYHWGGLVSPQYQALHGLGFRLESLSYLAAAMVPFVGIFALEGWRRVAARRSIMIAFTVGFFLVIIAMPDLYVPETIDLTANNSRFQGIAATLVKKISFESFIQQITLALLAGLGLSGLVGLWHCRDKETLLTSLTFWSMLLGWSLYALTRGFVFDRFLLTWAFLLPILWVQLLPRELRCIQYVGLAFITVYLAAVWLN